MIGEVLAALTSGAVRRSAMTRPTENITQSVRTGQLHEKRVRWRVIDSSNGWKCGSSPHTTTKMTSLSNRGPARLYLELTSGACEAPPDVDLVEAMGGLACAFRRGPPSETERDLVSVDTFGVPNCGSAIGGKPADRDVESGEVDRPGGLIRRPSIRVFAISDVRTRESGSCDKIVGRGSFLGRGLRFDTRIASLSDGVMRNPSEAC